MRIRIVDIDFAKSAAAVEVAPGRRGGPLEHVRAFVSRCKALGLNIVQVYYDGQTPPRMVTQLQSLCTTEQLPPPQSTPAELKPASSPPGLPPNPHAKSRKKVFTEYTMSFGDMDTVIGDLTTTVMLIGEAADIDPRNQFMLRLCIYELIVNTVEHGTFDVDLPEVSVTMRFTDDSIIVSYADNATVFIADGASAVDMVEEQIKSSSKRGLGLYLLNNICSEWKSERAGDWNVTTFSLEIKRDKTPVSER